MLMANIFFIFVRKFVGYDPVYTAQTSLRDVSTLQSNHMIHINTNRLPSSAATLECALAQTQTLYKHTHTHIRRMIRWGAGRRW